MTNKHKHDPLKKYYGLLNMDDQRFLANYMKYVNTVWKEYLSNRKSGSSGGMTMSKREEILKQYRDRLHVINIKHKKG